MAPSGRGHWRGSEAARRVVAKRFWPYILGTAKSEPHDEIFVPVDILGTWSFESWGSYEEEAFHDAPDSMS